MTETTSVCKAEKSDVYNYIHTIEEKCVGCNKCVRGCPAIYANVAYLKDGKTKIKVDQEKCIRCGHCLEQCDHGARDYHDDTERFFKDIESGKKISVIAAPAVRFNFDNYRTLFGYLKRIGINLIYDVSFGADICTWAYLKAIKDYKLDSVIAQPCPAIVAYIERYMPSLIEKLAPIHSPALCTAVYLKKHAKIEDNIAFLSPCIGKIEEFNDKNTKGLVTYNLTFKKLKQYIENNRIHLRGCDEVEYDDIGCGLGLTFSR
ncbi:MAG: [Fe-Fe] hydrogenase large subunit C-terminal domain-containing protein, partial [Vampirovibrionia bacterium]